MLCILCLGKLTESKCNESFCFLLLMFFIIVRNFGRSCQNNFSCIYSKPKIAIMARKKKKTKNKVRENFVFCRRGSWAVLAMLVLGQAWVYRYVSPQIKSRKSNQVPFFSMLKTGITLWSFKHLKDRSSKNNHVPQKRAKAKQRKRWELSLRSITAADGGEMAL